MGTMAALGEKLLSSTLKPNLPDWEIASAVDESLEATPYRCLQIYHRIKSQKLDWVILQRRYMRSCIESSTAGMASAKSVFSAISLLLMDTTNLDIAHFGQQTAPKRDMCYKSENNEKIVRVEEMYKDRGL
jgi:hypothetical protein